MIQLSKFKVKLFEVVNGVAVVLLVWGKFDLITVSVFLDLCQVDIKADS